MASPNIRELEARVRADRRALRDNRRRLRAAVEGRLASPATLLGGFAAGVAGGWLLKGPTRDKEVRRLRRELDRARSRAGSDQAPAGGRARLMALLPMITMGLRVASALRGAPQSQAPQAEEIATGGGPG